MSALERQPTSARRPVTDAVLKIWADRGAQNRLEVAGSSMLPLIQDGDRVLVAHGCAGVRRGDVVVFRHAGELVAHRVLHIHGGDAGPTFVTKGDNASQLDSPLGASEIVGRVLAVERGGRRTSLDTAGWRAVGWLIAVSTLAWTGLYGWCRALKRRLWGPEPTCATAALRRGAQATFSLVLQIAQAVACRWKDGGGDER